MAQTINTYNSKVYADKAAPLLTRSVTVKTGQGTILANTALQLELATGKYIKADTNATPANTDERGWVILLNDTDTSGGDVVTDVMTSGGIDESDIVFGGSETTAINDIVRTIFQMNNIFVNKSSSSITNV
ncbi:MAG: hypothetical protein ACTSRG_13115 [Candidatus Helarchaeota archaeon]